MVVDIKDRVPTYPNRKKITYEDGTVQYATVEYADEPIEEGTPVNRALLMPMQRKQEIARYTNSGTWTVPTGITSVDVYVVGGGGGGCTSGGGGGYCKLYRDVVVTPGEQVAIQIGAGGAAGNPAGNGGQSYFKNLSYAANGGLGGRIDGDAGGTRNGAGVGGNGGSGGGPAYHNVNSGIGGNGGSHGGPGYNYMVQSNPILFAGIGGGNIDYTPVNPYDQIAYGCGGGGWPGGCGGGCGGIVTEINDVYIHMDPGIGGGGGGGLGTSSGDLDSAATNGGIGGGGGGGHYRSTLAGNGGSGIVIIYG